jgi:ABC-2 type transport system permease protein
MPEVFHSFAIGLETRHDMIADQLHRIWGLAIKEFQQLGRNRLLLAFLILGPIMELGLMGGLSGGGVENLRLAVVDNDRTSASRDLISRLDRTDELRFAGYAQAVGEAERWMQDGDIDAVAVIPPGYAAALIDAAESAQIQLVADGSHHVVSTVAIGAAEDVAAEISRDLGASHASNSQGPVDLRFVARFNRYLKDRPHSITAMLGIVVFEVALVVAAQSIAREREMGTLEQLRVTPLGRLELMAGKAIPTLVVGLVDFLLMLGLAAVAFDIPVRGSVPLLVLLTVPFVVAQIGWGTLISLVSRTQQQAMLFVFALAMIEVAFSGFLVPSADMPAPMRIVSYASSVRHYLVVVRGVALRGAGMRSLWIPSIALTGIAAALVLLAWARLRMGLDAGSLRQRLLYALAALRERCRRPRRSKPTRERGGPREWSREPA